MRRGFSLVELIIYMGIFVTLLLMLTQVFQNSMDLLAETRADSAVSEDANFLMARLSFDIRRASTITLPASIGQSGSVLRLTIGGVTWEYGLSNERLTLTTGGQTAVLTTQRVTAFLVTATTEGVQVTWTLESSEAPLGGQATIQSFQTTIAPR